MATSLQCEGDGCVDQLEGCALVGGGLGEHGQVGVGAGDADLVAGEGGQVLEQVTEAAVGVAVLVALVGGLGLGGGGALGGGDGVVAVGWCLVGEGQRRPGFAEVPDQVAGEHADQHVGFDSLFEAVVDGAQVQVVDLDGAEVTFDVGEVLVGEYHAGRVQLFGIDAGAQHVDAVEGGFGVDLGLLAFDGQAGVGDGDLEVFADLVVVDLFADRDPDLVGAGQGAAPIRERQLMDLREAATTLRSTHRRLVVRLFLARVENGVVGFEEITV